MTKSREQLEAENLQLRKKIKSLEKERADFKGNALFHKSPVPLIELDCSRLMEHLATLRNKGVRDYFAHLSENPGETDACLRMIRILDANEAALRLINARDWDEAAFRITSLQDTGLRKGFEEMLIALAQGWRDLSVECSVQTLDRRNLDLLLHGTLSDDGGGNQTTVLAILDITRRKEEERELQANEYRMRRVLDATSNGLWDWNLETNEVYMSPSCFTSIGYRPDELEHTIDAWTTFLHPQDKMQVLRASLNLIRNGKPFTEEYRFRAKNGEWRWIMGRGQVVQRNDKGKPVRVAGTHTDITEMRLVRQELEEYKLLVEAMADNMSDLLWAKDLKGRMLFANLAVRRKVLRSDHIDPIGKPMEFFAQRMAPADTSHFDLGIRFDHEVISSQQSVSYEVEIPTSSAKLKLDVSKSPLYDEKGALIGVVGTGRDVTEQRNMEEALRRNETLLSMVVDASHDGFWDYDHRSGLVEYSRRWAEMVGLDGRGSIHINDMVERFVHPDDKQVVWDSVTKVLDPARSGVTAEFRARCQDGSWIWIYGRGKVVERDSKNRTVRVVAAMTDISELKQVQAELEEARNRAEAASRSKNEFLTNMSHEIRTPLNGVFGMLQLLDQSRLDNEQRDLVETALSSGRSLLTVINDVLDFSKMEAGHMDLYTRDFNLDNTVRTVLDTFKPQARSNGVRMVLDVDTDVPLDLHGDDARLRQVLFNLIGNALKFTSQGSVTLRIYSLPHDCSQRGMLLGMSVEDTGIGIPEDKLDHIFEPFTQADGSYTRRYQGTGLGLGIVRKLVHLMGGTISVDSAPGKGTEVHFTLRLQPAISTPESEVGRQLKPVESSCALKVLIAEDERVNQILLCRLLEKLGHSAECASNGEEALQMVQDGQYDCIFMDIQMPDMSGLQATEAIRGDARFMSISNIPIIAVTAHAMRGDRERFLEAGMNNYLPKPVEINELMDVLEEIMSSLGCQSA